MGQIVLISIVLLAFSRVTLVMHSSYATPCMDIPTQLFSLARTALGNRCMSAKGAYFHGGGAYFHCGGRVLPSVLANSKKSIGFTDVSGGSYLSDLSRRDERHPVSLSISLSLASSLLMSLCAMYV
jgi:hypothetical protein